MCARVCDRVIKRVFELSGLYLVWDLVVSVVCVVFACECQGVCVVLSCGALLFGCSLPLPLYHSFGLGCLLYSIFAGSTVVLLKNADNLENILESVKKYNATSLAAVPATLTKLLRLDRKILDDCLQGLRLIITNSTSIPKNTVKEIKGILKGGNLATYYGLTEASRSTFMIFNEDSNLHESVGKPAPGVNIKIDDEHKGDSEFGEILVKGKNVIKRCTEYLKK